MQTFWKRILHKLQQGQKIMLLYVTESEGSSPGRQGFKMFVCENGEMHGSIGGGIMEHKLVELSKSLLKKAYLNPFVKVQIHQDVIAEKRSGMICDGQQTIAFVQLNKTSKELVSNILEGFKENEEGVFEIDSHGIYYKKEKTIDKQFKWQFKSEEDWSLKEQIGFADTVFIIGGGHVGFALSEIMNRLGFYVINLDDRANLNTMEQNKFAHKKIFTDYDEIGNHIPEGRNHYVALMSFGYRTDEQCIKQLLGKKYKYFGVMGSQVKMDKLFDSLLKQGFTIEDIEHIYSPIGIKIKSKKPMEIAISVAAQIIAVKNGAI